jgi:tight adherence protein B
MRAPAKLVAAGAAALIVAGAAHAADPGYRLRHVDPSGYPTIRAVVEGAASSAPVLYENGARVQLASRENLGRSKALVLAIDRSQSMRKRPLAAAVAAAGELLVRKRPADEVAVLSFASRAEPDTEFSQATIDGQTALRALSTDPVPGTALYDAVAAAAHELERQPLPGRVLVLLTDGRDVGSTASLATAVAAARHAGMVIYTIGLGNANRGALSLLARQTAGRFYTSPTTSSLSSIYRRIADELDSTWTLAYVTATRPGDRVSVSVAATHGAPGPATSLQMPGSSVTPSGRRLPHFLTTRAGTLVLSVLAGLILFGIVVLLQSTPRSVQLKRRVWEHTEPQESPRRTLRRRRPTLEALLATLDERLRGLPQWTSLSRLAERSGLLLPPATAVLVATALALVLAVLGAVIGGPLVALLGIVVGLLAPLVALRLVAAHRLRAFDNQLPDLLSTVASTLRAGHGLRAALQTVADEGAPPASIELRRVLAEARLGRPLDEAFIAMCERLGWDDLLYVATAVQVQSQVGGSLAGVFTTVANTVRQRQQHRRRIRALTATGRSGATVLTVLPFAFAGLITAIDPNYMLPFLRSHSGHLLLVLCLISLSIGTFLLHRIVTVKA